MRYKHDPYVRKYAESIITTVVLFCLLLISFFTSSFLTFIFGFLFCFSLIYQFVLYRGKKSHKELQFEELDDRE